MKEGIVIRIDDLSFGIQNMHLKVIPEQNIAEK
jgi:hypothetical protein